ncbi:hypothetical protein FVE85_2471 [Porphyridium purpureum]|uniref:Uncharacterized protein n=1 Tax=Porphyridium purpureum TaxID=35688 RepID=A0A5J4YJ72_PORPP|nr:hypothetical protein FVE85_2471 [Porphyridium purpureum]|eukprot:POR6833..scf291_13
MWMETITARTMSQVTEPAAREGVTVQSAWGEKGGESSGHAQLTNDALVDDLTDDDMEIELGMYYSDIETQGSSSDGAGRAASGLAQLANARMPHNDAPHQKGARQHQDSVADKEHQAQKDTHRSLFCQSALQRSRARRMYRSLSCRPDSVEDFCIHNDPNKCVEVKFGSMRRTWTFLDLRLELDPAAADPPGAGEPPADESNKLRRSKTVQ